MVTMSDETKKTLVLVGVFGFLSIALMTSRLVMRRVRKQKLDWSE